MILTKMIRISALILVNLTILAVKALPASEKGKLLTPEQGCGITDKVPIPRIVGGINAKNGAFPWMALLGYGSPKSVAFDSGGTLITSRHVLTAAHCVTNKPFMVRLGEHNITTDTDGPVQDIRVVKIDIHEKYDRPTINNDVAILTLERDVEFSNRIRPICLPKDEARNRNFIGSKAIAAGWGRLVTGGRQSMTLQQVQLPVLPNKSCQSYGTYYRNDTNICAGEIKGGEGICQGDSGGPLMAPISVNGVFPFYQIGVSSYTSGYGCAYQGQPSVFARVQHFMDWIQSKINNSKL